MHLRAVAIFCKVFLYLWPVKHYKNRLMCFYVAVALVGCMQLHGAAKSFQLAKMSYENKAR